MRAELDLVFGPDDVRDNPAATGDPVLEGFRDVVRRRRIPRLWAEELVAGMAMDVGPVRYDSHADLLVYCYRLLFALLGLRQSAPSWTGALAAGLGAGTTGALLGELACHRGAHHVLVYHLGAWAILALACVALSRMLRPRTFAP